MKNQNLFPGCFEYERVNVMLNIAYVHAVHTPYVMEHYHNIGLVSDHVSKTSNYRGNNLRHSMGVVNT